MSRLNFLARIIDLRPTESNIRETDTGLEAEAGPSQHEQQRPSEEDVPGPSEEEGREAQNPPEDDAQQEDQPRSSSPTLPLSSSPLASIPQRMRRRREAQNLVTRREIDRCVMDYIGRTISDDGEEAFCPSLAQHLRRIPMDLRLNTKTSIMHLIHAATPPQNPRELFEIIEKHHQQLSACPDASISGAAHVPATRESQQTPISRPNTDSGRPSLSVIAIQSWPRHISVEGHFGQEHGNIGQPPPFVAYSNPTITNIPPTHTQQAWPPYQRHYGQQGQYGPQYRAANVIGQGAGWLPRDQQPNSNFTQHSNIFQQQHTQEPAFYSHGQVDYVPSQQQPIRTQANTPAAITQNTSREQSTLPEGQHIPISTSSPTTSHHSFLDL
ncbi:uncharacterized protein LOC143766459 [Ranitomeya variabilis]|uniref:uncharacterized protein LOC143766459 n=1 Tax=Ranitomeya variabilis TaxID=490064 RepID=UPI00405616CE